MSMEGLLTFLKFCGKASVPVIIMAICLYFLFLLLHKQTEHVYNLYFEKFKNNLSEEFTKFQKCIDMSFRDEEPRSRVVAETILKSDEIRLNLYKRTYSLFFEILYSQDKILKAEVEEQKAAINELFEKINNLRIDLFINSIHLGSLIDCLLPAQIGLWNDLGVIKSKIDGTWNGLKEDFYKSSEEIRKAEIWLKDNSKEYLTLNNIELSEDEINTLHESRKKMIDETIKQASVAGGV